MDWFFYVVEDVLVDFVAYLLACCSVVVCRLALFAWFVCLLWLLPLLCFGGLVVVDLLACFGYCLMFVWIADFTDWFGGCDMVW